MLGAIPLSLLLLVKLIEFEFLYLAQRRHIFQTFTKCKCLEQLHRWVPDCYTLRQPFPFGEVNNEITSLSVTIFLLV
jgi:hypothetical protein